MIGIISVSVGPTNILFIVHRGINYCEKEGCKFKYCVTRIIFCGWSQSRIEIEIVYLLQPVTLPTIWHLPFHFDGGGPTPLSLKLGASI